MTSRTAGRIVRSAVVVLLLALAVPASAAGTGGIEISPYPGVVDGKQLTAFRAELPRDGASRSVRYSLRNTTSSSRTARLYAASATRNDNGEFTVGGAGSSTYVTFPTREVTLPGGASQVATFSVQGKLERDAYSAIVVEVTQGSVTQRAATIVYLSPGPVVPVPVLLAVVAALLIAAAGVGVWVARRRKSV